MHHNPAAHAPHTIRTHNSSAPFSSMSACLCSTCNSALHNTIHALALQLPFTLPDDLSTVTPHSTLTQLLAALLSVANSNTQPLPPLTFSPCCHSWFTHVVRALLQHYAHTGQLNAVTTKVIRNDLEHVTGTIVQWTASAVGFMCSCVMLCLTAYASTLTVRIVCCNCCCDRFGREQFTVVQVTV